MNFKKLVVGTISGTMLLSSMTLISSAKNDDSIDIKGTHSQGTELWKDIGSNAFTDSAGTSSTDITIDSAVKYQDYSGIGFSIDETSVSNLWKLDATTREETIKKLVSTKDGAGLDQFRITIGSPDCIEHVPFWSYDELPEGVDDDFDLKYFSIKKDQDAHIVETVKLIQKYNPDAKFFASAWSAPAWMTTSGTFTGWLKPDGNGGYIQDSKLRDDCIEVFAKYYAKFIKAYKDEGIDIEAITELNEPGMDVIYPAMNLTIEQQQKLAIQIKKEFKAQNIDTKLWMHDFNFWDWKDPASTETKNYYRIFEGELGEATKEAADGVGFHPYWGDASVMADTYKETNMPVYLTESGGMDPGTIMDYFRYNCSSYNGWVQVTDQDGGTLHWTDQKSENHPETDIEAWNKIGNSAGAHWKGRLVTVNTDSKSVSYNNSVLGGLGQMAKYLDYGAKRVYSSNSQNGITNVVYCNKETKETKDYVMVLNNTGAKKAVDINMAGKTATVDVASGYTTLTWSMPTSTGDNNAPTINAVENLTGKQFEKMQVQLSATDQDGDNLTYYGLDVPSGVEIDAKTGLLTWTPETAGQYNFTIAVTDGRDNAKISFTANITSAPVPVPNKINTNISNIKDGDSASYQLQVSDEGTYMVELNYTTNGLSAVNGQKIALSVDGKKVDEKNLAVTWSGNGAVIMPVPLTKGQHDLKLDFTNNSYNLNYINITAATTNNVPGNVEAEAYINSKGVNLEPQKGGYNISDTGPDDFMEYAIKASTTGEYTVALNASSATNAASLDIYVDNEKVGTVTTESTGAWATYKTHNDSTKFTLTKGDHRIKLVYTKGLCNVDFLVFKTDTETIDSSQLEKAINIADKIDLSEYITTGKADFETALTNAKAIIQKTDATQDEINNATNALTTATNALIKKADKNALSAAIKTAEALDLNKYTGDKDAFNKALTNAKALLNNENALQDDVDKATAALYEAKNNLVEIVSKDEIKQEISKTEALNAELYSPASYQAVQVALAKAQALVNDDKASKEDIAKAILELQEARNNLVSKAAISHLEKLIAKAQKLDLNLYQDKNKDEFNNALNNAIAIVANPTSQKAIDEATSLLQVTMDSLVKKDQPTVIPTNPTNPGNTTTTTTKPTAKKSVKTGDDSAMLSLMTLLGLSAVVAAVTKKRED